MHIFLVDYYPTFTFLAIRKFAVAVKLARFRRRAAVWISLMLNCCLAFPSFTEIIGTNSTK